MPKREIYQRDPERYREQARAWAERNKERACTNAKAWYHQHGRHKVRDWNLKAYGLTRQTYDVLIAAQDGHCAVCPSGPAPGLPLCVDHDHVTHRVRGLLCRNCNAALGQAKDSADILRRLADYLDAPAQAVVVAFARPVKRRISAPTSAVPR